MPAVAEVQAALADYVSAVNARLAELDTELAAAKAAPAADDLQPLADELAAAKAALTPQPVEG